MNDSPDARDVTTMRAALADLEALVMTQDEIKVIFAVRSSTSAYWV